MPPASAHPLSRLRTHLRRHWPLYALLLPCLALAAADGAAQRLLGYNRTAILAGQWWRLFTGNFVHLGPGHLAEDMAGLVLLWLLFEDVLAGWRTVAVVCLGAVAVGLGLLLGNPGLEWYAGISGALDTLWTAGAIALLHRRDRFGWALAALLGAKLAYEQLFGALPFSSFTTGGPVIVDAHLYGAFAGALLGFGGALPWRRIMRATKQGDLP